MTSPRNDLPLWSGQIQNYTNKVNLETQRSNHLLFPTSDQFSAISLALPDSLPIVMLGKNLVALVLVPVRKYSN